MSTVIRVSDQLYEKLKKYATPFEDTPASVIERILNFYEEANGGVRVETPKKEQTEPNSFAEITINPNHPYDLMWTKISAAKIGDYKAKNWNDLVRIAHIVAFKSIGDIDRLIQKSFSRIVKKDMENESGYSFVPELGCSIQGVDANTAWKHVLHLAAISGEKVVVLLAWRNDKRAAYPGKTGYLKWSPN